MKDSHNIPEKWRLFVGVTFAKSVVQETLRIQKYLQPKGLFVGRWTKPENLHLTLKFLGEVNKSQLSQITDALKSIQCQPFNAVVGELGVFSSKKAIRILWLHLQGEELLKLQKHVDNALEDHFRPETRFMSHLTIARIKSVANRERFIEEVDRFNTKPIEILVDEFSLIRSSLTPDGAVYTTVCNYPCDPESQ